MRITNHLAPRYAISSIPPLPVVRIGKYVTDIIGFGVQLGRARHTCIYIYIYMHDFVENAFGTFLLQWLDG